MTTPLEHPLLAELLNAMNNPALPQVDLSLDRMKALLKALGDPHKKLPPTIHVAGTNGKGSTLAFLRAIYEAAGYRVHVYTSPHLVCFNERIVLAGAQISDDGLLDVLSRVQAANVPATYFEATTAAAFLAFAEHGADVLLLETGLGGRLDATNMVAHPIATILTPIDYDHMEFLGDTLTAIAGEKAGILKPHAPCFVGEQKPESREVIKRAARKIDCPLILHARDWRYEATKHGLSVEAGKNHWSLPFPALTGVHQRHNAALASVVAIGSPSLPVTVEQVAKGIAQARWPARLQPLVQGPLVETWTERGGGAVMLDGGHNASAADMLRGWMAGEQQPMTLLFGMMKRKDATAFLVKLAPHVRRLIAVPIAQNECHTPQELVDAARAAGMTDVVAVQSIEGASALLAPEPKEILLIAGSLFLAGEVLKNHS